MDATTPILKLRRAADWPTGAALRPFAFLVLAAVAITVLQIAAACAASGHGRLVTAWQSLCQWDGGWYRAIVEHGYAAPEQLTHKQYCSVGFFPGYPVLTRLVQGVFGLETPSALLVTSQCSAVAFWTYLLLLLRRWRASGTIQTLGVACIAAHPGAFFLIASYAESLFLAAFLGFLFWSRRAGTVSWVVAAVHGICLTSTRLVGLPLVFMPLLYVWSAPTPEEAKRAVLRRAVPAAALALTSALGVVLFFGYLHWRFGRWDLYLEAQRLCWGVAPDYLAFFRSKTYGLPYLAVQRLFGDVAHVNRLMVPLTLAGGVLVLLGERNRTAGAWRQRLPLFVTATILLGIPVCSYAALEMLGMIRYAACVHVFLVLMMVHQARHWPAPAVRRWAWCAFPGVALALAMQLWLVWRFTHGRVVA